MVGQFDATCGQWWQFTPMIENVSSVLCFSQGTVGMWLQDMVPNATPSSVLYWLETVINQNAEQQLALC